MKLAHRSVLKQTEQFLNEYHQKGIIFIVVGKLIIPPSNISVGCVWDIIAISISAVTIFGCGLHSTYMYIAYCSALSSFAYRETK